ncbi:MAG: SRPBCC family protein [Myxococcaceae bacterium]
MALEIAKTFVVNATPEAVWSFLVDLPRVARCLPGAAIGERLDEKTSSGTMTIKVGPVSSTYRGKVVFERLDAAARTAELVATGQDVRGKGGADLRLTSSVKALSGGRTEVTAVSLVNVTGILAQMGRGMIQDVSDEMFQIFSERMRAELESGGAATPTDGAGAGAPSQAAARETDGGAAGSRGAPAAGAGLAPSTSPSVPTAGRSGSPPPAEALDAAALGARVARRSAARWARQPGFWVVVLAVLAAAFYLLLHRSS